MIDSILERKRRRITLDKVLVQKPDGPVLITDPIELDTEINLHYQTAAKAVDTLPALNERWDKQYSPKSYVNRHWYDSVMAPIEDAEWRTC
jgi:hypothetical protein